MTEPWEAPRVSGLPALWRRPHLLCHVSHRTQHPSRDQPGKEPQGPWLPCGAEASLRGAGSAVKRPPAPHQRPRLWVFPRHVHGVGVGGRSLELNPQHMRMETGQPGPPAALRRELLQVANTLKGVLATTRGVRMEKAARRQAGGCRGQGTGKQGSSLSPPGPETVRSEPPAQWFQQQ